jgi:endo-1,3-1,4-beta-glycanase ExoK
MHIIRGLFCFFAVLMALGCAPAKKADASDFFKVDFTYLSDSFWYVSDGWANGTWQSCEWRRNAVATHSGMLILTLSDRGGAQRPIGCAEIHTRQAPGYGLYEARLRAAAGSGLNTAFFTYTGPVNHQPWDEIDFEFLGKDTHAVQTGFYTDGKPHGGANVQLGYDASAEFHDYAIDWQPAKISWYVDGKLVHESPPGAPIPSHPGALFFSLWSGGAEENGWLGVFHYTVPVTANVEWAAFTPSGLKCRFPESMSCKH